MNRMPTRRLIYIHSTKRFSKIESMRIEEIGKAMVSPLSKFEIFFTFYVRGVIKINEGSLQVLRMETGSRVNTYQLCGVTLLTFRNNGGGIRPKYDPHV